MSKPSAFVRIPKERVGALVGADGNVKRHIEEKLGVKLEVESESGGVTAVLKDDVADPSLLLKAKDVVTAIGRGFAPERALRLIRDEEAIFDLIDLREVFGRSESDIKRVKGRIIGMNGKTRRLIEELSSADVVVYGHTVGIIGTFEQANVARSAVQMLIEGRQHHTVYKFLQRKRSELKKQMLELWEKPEDEK
ncbi:MAG: KH domain-containing protein [Candidatus Bathyarchaeota archaeon]|nr:KH domain-containing protein [Candidatus Bathyarchaeota archaeon]